MGNYYAEQKKAFQALDNKIRTNLEENGKINVTKAILELTADFAVSEKALNNRIEGYLTVNPNLDLKGGWLIENVH